MPVTQSPYDATRFSLRQTSGEIGIFGSFTSLRPATGIPQVAEELADSGREIRVSVLSYIFCRQSTSVGGARWRARPKFAANQPEIPATRAKRKTQRVALTSPEGSRISRANRAPAPKLCLTDKLRKTRVLRAAEKVP